MTLQTLTIFLLALALILAAIGAVRRAALWRKGRPAAVPLIGGLLAAPKRYFVDLHHVVSRDAEAARFHVPTAGGFVASIILLVLIDLLGIGGRPAAWLLLAALIVMAAGASLVWRRRYHALPPWLSKGPWQRLPISLLVFAAAFALVTLPRAGIVPPQLWTGFFALVLALGIAWGLAEMLLGLTWGGPMKHAFAGILHLAYHPRPRRFGHGPPASALRPLDLDAPQWGVARAADLPWNSLLGFDACVQCGRCEAMCPAYAAGQPLSPKKFIQDMWLSVTGGSDAGYAGNPYPGRPIGSARAPADGAIVPQLIAPETIWACTTCRACVYECPMMIEHVDSIIDIRRFLTLEQGETPGKGAETLDDIRATDNTRGSDPEHRADWATDLAVPILAEAVETDILFWAGDGAFDLRNQRSLRAVASLLRKAGVRFAILGNEEADCGDLARRLGDEATFQALARRNIATLAKYRFNRIVTADPHAFHMLANEYPALGGHYTVLHHTQLLDELMAGGKLAVSRPLSSEITYHDPCYLGRYNGEIAAPRRLLDALGMTRVEMARSGFRSRCCGGGGGAPITDIPGERRIPDMRMADIVETGVPVVAVACPQCCTMLEGVVQPRAEVRDIAELLLEATGA